MAPPCTSKPKERSPKTVRAGGVPIRKAEIRRDIATAANATSPSRKSQQGKTRRSQFGVLTHRAGFQRCRFHKCGNPNCNHTKQEKQPVTRNPVVSTSTQGAEEMQQIEKVIRKSPEHLLLETQFTQLVAHLSNLTQQINRLENVVQEKAAALENAVHQKTFALDSRLTELFSAVTEVRETQQEILKKNRDSLSKNSSAVVSVDEELKSDSGACSEVEEPEDPEEPEMLPIPILSSLETLESTAEKIKVNLAEFKLLVTEYKPRGSSLKDELDKAAEGEIGDKVYGSQRPLLEPVPNVPMDIGKSIENEDPEVSENLENIPKNRRDPVESVSPTRVFSQDVLRELNMKDPADARGSRSPRKTSPKKDVVDPEEFDGLNRKLLRLYRDEEIRASKSPGSPKRLTSRPSPLVRHYDFRALTFSAPMKNSKSISA